MTVPLQEPGVEKLREARDVHKTAQLSTLNQRLLVRGVPRRCSATQYATFHPHRRQMHIAGAPARSIYPREDAAFW